MNWYFFKTKIICEQGKAFPNIKMLFLYFIFIKRKFNL